MVESRGRVNFALITTFVILVAVTTTIIRIPVPATTGYFNLGDIFIIGAGLLFGPLAGMVVGAIGAGAADLFGYPQFVLATVVTKGVEGLLVGLVAQNRHPKASRIWFAASLGAATMVVGYFVFEAFVYPFLGKWMPFFNITNFQDAVVELVPNAVQGVIGAVGGVGIWRALSALRSER